MSTWPKYLSFIIAAIVILAVMIIVSVLVSVHVSRLVNKKTEVFGTTSDKWLRCHRGQYTPLNWRYHENTQAYFDPSYEKVSNFDQDMSQIYFLKEA